LHKRAYVRTISIQFLKKYLRKYLLALIFASKYLRIMEVRRDVFQAIADPTRRAIINMVSKQPLNLNSLAEQFDMSRQAVSLHVKILTECGLIIIKQEGRERFCEAKLDGLNEAAEWIEQFKQYFESKLDSLEKYLAKTQKTKKHAKRKR
jgi:DNA-binding transcriptional ArsR family regulator